MSCLGLIYHSHLCNYFSILETIPIILDTHVLTQLRSDWSW